MFFPHSSHTWAKLIKIQFFRKGFILTFDGITCLIKPVDICNEVTNYSSE